MDPAKLSILKAFFPNPRPAIIYALSKVPELALKLNSDIKHLTMPSFIKNDFLEQFPVLNNLESLTIESLEALDSGVIHLTKESSQTLTKIILDGTKITTTTLQELKACANLEWLSVNKCQFAENPFDALLDVLKSTIVTQLFIKEVPHLTEQQIGELVSVRPMTRLGFRKTDTVGIGLFSVLQEIPNALIRLDLENFDELTITHVVALLNAFQSLKAISFLDGAAIEAQLATQSHTFKHPALEELITPLGRCKNIPIETA